MSLETSAEICEALVRHVEIMGSEVFEKTFVKDGRIVCAVWCMVGPNAEAFNDSIKQYLEREGFHLD